MNLGYSLSYDPIVSQVTLFFSRSGDGQPRGFVLGAKEECDMRFNYTEHVHIAS